MRSETDQERAARVYEESMARQAAYREYEVRGRIAHLLRQIRDADG